ncbi:MAG: DUF1566 domain-containing protein [Nitrospirae bacterium]|nr:DUF1566 domain-containing protein [Nitrospirota bacterium]
MNVRNRLKRNIERVSVKISFAVIAVFFLTGCAGKKAGIEGQVVDGKGGPMANVKITARQTEPVRGYEHFETVTDQEGRFSFKAVHPSSEYSIIINPEGAGVRIEKIMSGAENLTSRLSLPVMIRFLATSEGIITDSKTGLQWVPDPGRGMTWHDAKKYVRGLKTAELTDWRLPTRSELRSLSPLDPTFPLDNCCVWTAETKDAEKAWYLNVFRTFEETAFMHNNSYSVLAVRSPK